LPQPARRWPSSEEHALSVYTFQAMDLSRVKLTYGDLLALPDDGKRHELIDGEHYVTATPTLRHQRVLGNLHWPLRGFVHARKLGEVLFAPFDVLFSASDVLEPDLLFVAQHRLSILEERFVRGAPDLVVEVLSPSTRGRDAGVKRRAYRRFGVTEYWMVDPVLETIEIYRGPGDWSEPAARFSRAAGSRILTSPLFPGLALDLDEIFA
jgi:Uma2 family endonuclease